MKTRCLGALFAFTLTLVFSGCTSIVRVAPFPNGEAWSAEVKRLGIVTADSGRWPLSLHSLPPEYTFQAALRSAAGQRFGVPEGEIVLGEATVKIMAEIDGTIRSWKATAEAGQRKSQSGEKSPSAVLVELKKLLDAGVISQGDYDVKKKALLEKL